MYLSNAFSINMFKPEDYRVNLRPLSVEEAREMLGQDFVSCVGREDTARVISGILGIEVPVNRVNVELDPDSDYMVVAQYSGPRLEDGAVELPDGAKIEFWFVEIWSRVQGFVL